MKKIIKLILIIVALLAIILMVNEDIASRKNADMDYIYAELDGEIINIFKNSSDEYYLFLPSYSNVEDVEYSEGAKDIDINILKSANLDTVFINTKSNSLEKVYADKEYEETGSIRVFSKDGERIYEGGLSKISGRGNYSWTNWEKKPFSISLARETDDLLNLPGGGSFALIANASDATFLRNDIARKLEVVSEIDYAHEGRYVDLFINGDYMGNYYLMDTIDIGEKRINVTNLELILKNIYKKSNLDAYTIIEEEDLKATDLPMEPVDLSGGYLIEREFEGRYKLELPITPSGFVTKNKEHFFIRSPKYSSYREVKYLKDLLDQVENAIYSDNDQYKEYIDTDSFAKRYLIEEVTKNYDAGVSSAFFFKDTDTVDSKLKMAPGWDYDMSLGNYLDWMEYYGKDATGLTLLSIASSHSDWWKSLYEKEDFQNTVSKIYEDKISNRLDTLVKKEIDEYRDFLSYSATMDSVRWHDMYEEKGYDPTDTKEYEKLKEFISIRKEFLDSLWITE